MLEHSKAPRIRLPLWGAFEPETLDAAILGCTEIPLIIDDTNSPVRLLARAALHRAVQEVRGE